MSEFLLCPNAPELTEVGADEYWELKRRIAELEQQVRDLREAPPVPPNYWPWL